MTILVAGASGQVGQEIVRLADIDHVAIAALDLNELDITEARGVRAAFANIRPSLVINCAAYTAVDRAEEEEAEAFAANRQGPALLADACREADIPLLHISTDYVFDGSKPAPYVEDDPVNPLSVYGRSKAAGEQAIRERLPQHLILRTSWVFGMHGNNFVKTMLRLGSERRALSVVDDQHGCPTAARDIATALIQIARRYMAHRDIAWGTYHFALPEATSWHGFASTIFSQWRELTGMAGPELTPIPSAAYPTAARRPSNSVLDCTKFDATFGIRRRHWQDALREMLQEMANHEGL